MLVHDKRMIILSDIGGTFIRFAVASEDAAQNIQKYEVNDFKSMNEALKHYCAQSDLQVGGNLRIAYAGYHGGDIYELYGSESWLNPSELEKNDWSVEIILNDFEAAVLALPHLSADEQQLLNPGKSSSDSLCLIGPGTGLGLAYLHDGTAQMTCGGHMPASAITQEQRDIIAQIQKDKAPVTFEHLVSGSGLFTLYETCSGEGIELEEFLDNLDDAAVKTALRLFHEFMGLFAANSVITGHAYGGLYLTGGVMERLMEKNAFDLQHFKAFFHLDIVDGVKRPLHETPIHYVTYSYPALKGLLHA